MRKLIIFFILGVATVISDTQETRGPRVVSSLATNRYGLVEESAINDELIMSFVVFRHGDRTPDPAELTLFPAWKIDDKVFYPHGKKALTMKGKQRAFVLGEFLRQRYNDSISELYLPEEISIRTTDYARTKMSALSVLAAFYMPTELQRWHPDINWQPVPYSTVPFKDDDLLYFENCGLYKQLLKRVYDKPELRNIIDSYKDLFKLLNEETGNNITTPEEVFFLDNLFQATESLGVTIPQWAQDFMPQIKSMTKIDYYCQYYNKELIKLASGVLMSDIVNKTKAAIAGNAEVAKLYLYSAHEHNVAALLAAVGVFVPHQPKYSSAVILELRRNLDTGKYGVMVVYVPETGGPGQVLPIAACGQEPICDYEKFILLTKDLLLTRQELTRLCSIPFAS